MDTTVELSELEPVSSLPAVLPPAGSARLRIEKHELYAHKVAALIPKAKAYCEVFGYDQNDPAQYHAARGNASRLERRKDVQARIAWLSRQSEDMLAAKRERLESWLWSVMEHNPAEMWEIAERPMLDEKGKPVIDNDTGDFVMVKYQRARFLKDLPIDAMAAVEGIQITESGKVITKTYSKMQANQELRKLLGIGATNGSTNADDLDGMSTAEIVAELQTLGVDVRLSVTVQR